MLCGYDVVGVAQQTSALLVRVQVPLSAILTFIRLCLVSNVWTYRALTYHYDLGMSIDILFSKSGGNILKEQLGRGKIMMNQTDASIILIRCVGYWRIDGVMSIKLC